MTDLDERCTAETRKGARCRKRAEVPGGLCLTHMGARPSALTPETATKIFASIKSGLLVSTAIRANGVATSTFYDAVADGLVLDGDPRPLAERLDEAKAASEATNLRTVIDAAEKDWRAARWLLEHQDPDTYGPQGGAAGVPKEPTPGGPDGAPNDMAGL